MNLLNKLTVKNLKLNKKRTVVTIIGIMLSVALITAVASVYMSGITSLMRFESKQMGDFHIAYNDVPIDELSVISNNKAIKDFYLVRNVGYAKIASANEYKPYAYIKSFNKKALENLSVNLLDGVMPTNEHEILIPEHLETNGRLKYKVGDELTLKVGKRVIDDYELNQYNSYSEDEKIVDTSIYKYKVVGIIARPASNIEGYSAPGYTFITYDESLKDGTYDVYTKYNKYGLKNLYEVTGNILGLDGKEFKNCNDNMYENDEIFDKCNEMFSNAKYNTEVNEYLIALETNPIGSDMVTGLETIAIVVCLIIVFTSVFCIKNSFDISITEKIKQYGMLKSVGATQKQIKKNVFFEATILGIFGIPLGILCGTLASYILMLISNLFVGKLLDIELSYSFSFIAVLVAIVLGIVTIYLSALSSARKASKVSPIESIRNAADIKINPKKIKSPKFVSKLFGVGGEISYKNLKRNKKKYRTTVISIIVSVFVFIALSSFMDIIFRSIKEDFKTTEYNLYIGINNPDKKLSSIYNEILLDESVTEYSVNRQTSILVENGKLSKEEKDYSGLEENPPLDISIVSLDDAQYKKYIKSLGLKEENIKDKVILTDTIKRYIYNNETKKTEAKKFRKYAYQVGDVINGIIGDSTLNLEVGAITDVKTFGNQNAEGFAYIVVKEETLNDICYREKLCSVSLFIRTNDANKLQDSAENILKDYSPEIDNSDQSYRMITNLYLLVAIFLYGFIIVISLIGITNIFNTITTNMTLRKREFAMLKSVGMTKKEFNRMIRLESLFMGIKSLFYGIIIGLVLSYLVFLSIDQDILTYHIPFKGIIISIVVVFMIIFMIMGYSISKINKQNTIETIRNENI